MWSLHYGLSVLKLGLNTFGDSGMIVVQTKEDCNFFKDVRIIIYIYSVYPSICSSNVLWKNKSKVKGNGTFRKNFKVKERH